MTLRKRRKNPEVEAQAAVCKLAADNGLTPEQAVRLLALIRQEPPADPSAARIDALLREINSLRTNPQRYCAKLRAVAAEFDESGMFRTVSNLDGEGNRIVRTLEGISAVKECIAALQSTPPRSAWRLSPGLSRSAGEHASDIGTRGMCGYVGSDRSTAASRSVRYGQWRVLNGESIGYGALDPTYIVTSWLIDDGIACRSHRSYLLSGVFCVVGIGVAPHERDGTVGVATHAGGVEEGKNPALPATKIAITNDGQTRLSPRVARLLAAIGASTISNEVREALSPSSPRRTRVEFDYCPPQSWPRAINGQATVKITSALTNECTTYRVVLPS